MIKLGKMTDYAVAVLVQLAREGEAVSHSAAALADKTGLPEPTVAKVLKTLSREKLVYSARGAAGGYRLGRAAAHINMCNIVEALEGPIAIVECETGESSTCKSEASCPVRGRWSPVNKAIRAALEAVSLADMAATTGCAGVEMPRQLVQLTAGAN